VDRLTLDRLRLGECLDAAVEVAGQGEGQPPSVRISSGSADLRRMVPGAGGGQGGAVRAGPVEATLDRVTVAGGIDLTGFRGRLVPGAGGWTGRFQAAVNGQAPVEGRVEPMSGGTGFRVTSTVAGDVLAASGVFAKARGGSMDLTVVPAGGPGRYSGRIALRDFRVRDMSVLADLLSAVSIVGLLDQLNDQGIQFTSAEAALDLGPDRVVIRDGVAVGPSFGVTAEGAYLVRQGRIDLAGVISPLYLVNGIGAVLTRPGEGVFGFNYRISGPAASPAVSVNPLSVLAPGFLRNLFRAEPGASGGAAAARPSQPPPPPTR
jgi:hypothetical protein